MKCLAARLIILFLFLCIGNSLQSQVEELEIPCPDKIDLDKYADLSSNIDSFDNQILCGLLQFLDEPLDSTTYKKAKKISLIYARQRYSQSNYMRSAQFRDVLAKLALDQNDFKTHIDALYRISICYYRIGRNYKSFETIQKAMALARSTNDSISIRNVLHRQAWIYWKLERYDEALASMEEYMEISRRRNYKITLSLNRYYNGSASFYHSKGDHAKARMIGDSAIHYAQIMESPKSIGLAISNKVMYYPEGSAENFENRLKEINEALEINHDMNDREQLGSNYGVLAIIHKNKGNFKEAIDAFHLSLDYASTIGDMPRVLIAYKGLGDSYNSIGMFDKAYLYKNKEHALYKEIYGLSDINQIFDLEKTIAESQAAQKISQLEIQKNQSEADLQRQKFNSWLLGLGLISFLLVAAFFTYRQRQIQKLNEIILEQKSKEQIRDLEKTALRSQMNPHFMFNSLNSIKSYIATNEPRIATRFLNKFAQLMRIILSNSQEQEVLLAQEIRALQLYIELEQFRLKNGFDFSIEIDPELQKEEYVVPPLIVQPYVENSIWHGLVNKSGHKQLQITISKKGDNMLIKISDNGIGRRASEVLNKEKPNTYKSYGMKITKDRLRLNDDAFEEKSNIKILDKVDPQGNPLGTEVSIYLPLKTNVHDKEESNNY